MSASPPRFFLDRGLGSRVVPGALRAAGWDVVTMDERYGTDVSQEVDDATWIRDASARGECLLTKDVWIARRPAEAQQVVMSEARVFALKNARLTGEAMAGLFVLHGPSIVRWATRVSGPFVCGVGPRGLARVRLTWP